MTLFFLNLCLAFVAGALLGSFSFPVLLAGFAAGYAGLWLLRPLTSRSQYFKKFPKAVFFIFYVLGALLLSGLRVAITVLSPKPRMHPGVIAIPIGLKTDSAIFVMANAITLTPGTLSLTVSEDKKTLYVHGMFIEDPEAFRSEIRTSFERKVSGFLK